MTEPSVEPATIEVAGADGVTITWEDGHVTHLGSGVLRASCPCAECRGLRDRDLPVFPRPGGPTKAAADNAELVGGWGLSIHWSDGHSTGIYSWALLRSWCECDECLRADGGAR